MGSRYKTDSKLPSLENARQSLQEFGDGLLHIGFYGYIFTESYFKHTIIPKTKILISDIEKERNLLIATITILKKY